EVVLRRSERSRVRVHAFEDPQRGEAVEYRHPAGAPRATAEVRGAGRPSGARVLCERNGLLVLEQPQLEVPRVGVGDLDPDLDVLDDPLLADADVVEDRAGHPVDAGGGAWDRDGGSVVERLRLRFRAGG